MAPEKLHPPQEIDRRLPRIFRFMYRHRRPLPSWYGFVTVFLLATLLVLTCSCGAGIRPRTMLPYEIDNRKYYPIPNAEGFREKGIASWYGPPFHGRLTSNGEIYNMYLMTAAHKTLPMNTMLLVKNLENGRETVVRVNDRGPFIPGRIIDLSLTAANQLNLVGNGTAKVQITALAEGTLEPGQKNPTLHYQNLDSGDFYVQIGAFSERNNAERLKRRFTATGHTTRIQKYSSDEENLYRVQVYVGKNIQEARRSERALLERGYRGAFVIAR